MTTLTVVPDRDINWLTAAVTAEYDLNGRTAQWAILLSELCTARRQQELAEKLARPGYRTQY